MNANLLPFSSSTAGLEPGQEIFFKYKGEQRVLITISESDSGKSLNIGRLIKSRKRALKKEALLLQKEGRK